MIRAAEPSTAAPPTLEVRLLGDPEVLVEGRVLPLPASKKTRALLGYLVKTGRAQRRERLCELLWDGPDDPRAGLRWSLAKLRPLLNAGGAQRLVADRERVSFEAQGAVVDVAAVNSLAAGTLANASTQALQMLLAKFRGPFLEGLELSSCPTFYAWCVAEREGIRAQHVSILNLLVERHRSQPLSALTYARGLITLDPVAESPRLLLLDLLIAAGETQRALDEYDSYVRTLERELHVAPSWELERRRLAIVSAAGSPPRAAATQPPAITTTTLTSHINAAVAASRAPVASFVGREPERRALQDWLERRGQGTPVLLVSGEPGIGKTRLLEELGELTRARGGHALGGRAFEAELVRPYGAFIDALRAQFGADSPFAAQAADRERLYDAVLALLGKAAESLGPLVLVLDDVHWFDEASAGLLHYLARALEGSRIGFALAARKAELSDNPPVQRMLRALGRAQLLQTLELGPLSDDELQQLVAEQLGAADTDPARPAAELAPGALQRAVGEAAGNPLLALEAMRALRSGSEDVTGSLSFWLGERLERLRDAERALLAWAAALGRSFDVDVLALVTGLPVPELLASLQRLEDHAILRGKSAGYDFAHDVWRHAAYRQMSSPRQRLVHTQIAKALSQLSDHDGALASDIAHHASLAGDVELAARACITAGRRCLRMFAVSEGRDLSQRGCQLAATLPEAIRVPLLVELLSIQVLSETRVDLVATLLDLAERARSMGLAAVEARAFYLSSVQQFRRGENEAALQSALMRVEATRQAEPQELGVQFAGAARCCLLLEQNVDVAAQFVAEARKLLGDDSDAVDLAWSRGLLAHVQGDLDTAAQQLARALRLARQRQMHWEEAECLLELGWLDLERQRPEHVLEHTEELVRVAERLGESAYAAAARSLNTIARLASERRADFDAFEASLFTLRACDASRLLAMVLNRAAQLALSHGANERASHYAEQALAAASVVERASEIAVARVTLAEIALRTGQPDVARKHIGELHLHSVSADLSAKNARAIARVRQQIAQMEG